MVSRKNKNLELSLHSSRVVEDVLGCKWTVWVIEQISRGVQRPGELSRTAPGLTPKVLNERLRKLVRFRLVAKKVFPEIPPRVEYRLTAVGRRLVKTLGRLKEIEQELMGKNL